jgi:hypothetical protein
MMYRGSSIAVIDCWLIHRRLTIDRLSALPVASLQEGNIGPALCHESDEQETNQDEEV